MSRRIPAALVVCALLGAACTGDDSDGGAVGFGVGGDDGPGVVTTVGAGGPGDGGGAAGGVGGSATNGGGTGSPTPGSPDPGGRGSDGGSATLPSADGPPGSFAPGFLRPVPATTIVVEVHSQDDAAIRDNTRDSLVTTLADVTGKEIAVLGPHPFSDTRQRWTGSEIRDLADRHGRQSQGGDVAVMRIFLLRGEFEQDDVIGVAVQGAVMAIFVDEVRRAGSVVSGSRQIEEAVVIHEAGHLLGLVDLYLDTGRDDPDHPGHSTNQDSVMYWAVESSLVGQLLGAGPPTEFDEVDRRDLAAIAAGQGPG